MENAAVIGVTQQPSFIIDPSGRIVDWLKSHLSGDNKLEVINQGVS